MLIIGLTGPSGAGKGTVASLFSPYGIPSIDTDAVYHDLLIPPSPCLDGLAERFGSSILNPDGSLHRQALATLVFAPEGERDLEDLNRLTHGFVLTRVREICDTLRENDTPAVLVDAPLLFESGFDSECDRTLAVLADSTARISRIMARDGLSTEAALARMKAQKTDDFYMQRADAVIYNNGSPDGMAEEVHRLLTAWEVISP